MMCQDIAKYIVYPLHEFLRGRKTLKYLKDFEISQWYSPAQLKKLQLVKLKSLLKHAYENVPYYKEKFDKLNFNIQEFKTIDDLKKLPVITKDEIKENFSKLIAKGWEESLVRCSTGGSTGEPLIFLTSKIRAAQDQAVKMRNRRWWGIDLGDKELLLWGSPIERSNQSMVKSIRDRLMNCILLSAYELSGDSLAKHLQVIYRFRPKFIYGYATALYRFAQFIKKEKIDISNLGFKVIISTAEVLYDHYRELIESVFNCAVVNEYGARDGGLIGFECPQKKMHINSDYLIVEFVNSSNEPVSNGEVGEIVVTHLASFGMPFIRYKVGDLAANSIETCSCGRGLPLMKLIQGRTRDLIITPEGKTIHGSLFSRSISEIEGIKEFKIIQKSMKELVVLIVKDINFKLDALLKVEKKFQEFLGKETKINFEFVDKIPLDKSGKYRIVVSEIETVDSK
ncbi:MAG: phenylacetate--CoA ligase family protein [Nitrospirota bacterium]